MKWIRISDATKRAIAEAAIYPWHETGRRQADGSWLVPVDDEVHEAIQSRKVAGETDDDTIARMLHASHGRPSH